MGVGEAGELEFIEWSLPVPGCGRPWIPSQACVDATPASHTPMRPVWHVITCWHPNCIFQLNSSAHVNVPHNRAIYSLTQLDITLATPHPHITHPYHTCLPPPHPPPPTPTDRAACPRWR